MDFTEIIEKNKEKMLEDLKTIVDIRSVETAPEGEYPFGKGVNEAFERMLKLGEENGFATDRVGNYGGHIEYGSGDEVFAILAHIDTVPEGSGWQHEPFNAVIEDGKMYGRGTSDDKGPMIAAFYAMKALKESGFEPDKRIRLVVGLDEETNCNGMHKYFENMEHPAMGFTPDANFPAIQGEMGVLFFDIAKKMSVNNNKGLELRTMKGGTAANMVADSVRAVLRDTTEYKKGKEPKDPYEKVKALLAEYKAETGYKLNCKGTGKSLEITAAGTPAHGANPEAGLNAISVMCDFLSRLNFANEDANDFLDFYQKYIGFSVHGEKLNIDLKDEYSRLQFNVGLIDFNQKDFKLTLNVRCPIYVDENKVYEGFTPVLNHYDFGLVKKQFDKPLFIPSDSRLVSTLMDVYREYTGDKDSKPLVIAGGTYARTTENVVAYGMQFPYSVDTMHQHDEYVAIDELMLATKIYAEAIYRLCKKEE